MTNRDINCIDTAMNSCPSWLYKRLEEAKLSISPYFPPFNGLSAALSIMCS